MAYADFDIETVETKFGLTSVTRVLFKDVVRCTPPQWLIDHLERISGMSLNNEKVRSELLVSPTLLAVRELELNNLGMFSGVRFDVEPQSGLVGECDFILGLTPSMTLVRSPVVTMVEAKKADLDLGIGQCMAQMVAAQKFNAARNAQIPTYGCITTGREWQFLLLEQSTMYFHAQIYPIAELPLLLGIFRHMIADARAALAASQPSGSSKSA